MTTTFFVTNVSPFSDGPKRLPRGKKRVMESDLKGFKKEMITKTVACTASTWDGICYLENPNEGYRPQITLTTLETFYTMFGEVILTPPKIKNATEQCH